MRRQALIVAALAAVIGGMLPSHAAGGPIVAGPGSSAAAYYTPVVVWTPGTALDFVNTDITEHDVVSDATRAPGTAPWCPAGGPRCPLFYADLISLGMSSEVQGLHDIAPGVYVFRCTPHSWMEGQLVVV